MKKKTLCTKYVTEEEGKKLIKLADTGRLPKALRLSQIVFLVDPYSEEVQDQWHKDMTEAVASGELKASWPGMN